MTTYLLIAGTGAIGSYLTSALLKNKNNEVYVTSRKKRNSVLGEIYIEGDPHDILFMKKIFSYHKKFDVVVDFMVWRTKEFSNNYSLYFSSCNLYVYMSSARVYADIEGKISEKTVRLYDITNDNLFLCKDNYAVPKSEQENILLKSSKKNFIIVRPYITYSENRLPLFSVEKEIWLYRILQGRQLVVPEDLSSRKTSLMFGADCAKAIFNIIVSGKYIGEIINVTTNESVTWNYILQVYLRVLHAKGFDCKIKKIKESIRIKNQDYQAKYDRNFNREFDCKKLSQVIDTNEFKKIEFGLEYCLEKFLEHKSFNQSLMNWRFQAQLDSLTHELAKRKEFKSYMSYFYYLLFRFFPLNRIIRLIKKCILF